MIKKPVPKEDIDWSGVLSSASKCLENYYPDDTDCVHYMFGEIMETVYGQDAWDYINSKC